MRVRMLVGYSTPAGLLCPDDEAVFPADEAIRLIDRGFAVPATPKIERAVKKPAEKRVKRK
jgi:hypothetical protein